MKENIVKVEKIEEMAIKLPEDFAEVGEKVSVSVRDDGSMIISKFVPVEIELPNDQLFKLTMMAHEQDITLNELCNNILKEIIETDGKCLGLNYKHDTDRKMNMNIEEVIEDIHNLNQDGGVTNVFTEGYCYDFAYMLQRTFGGDIVYNKVDHYLLMLNNKFYDITGEVEPPLNYEIDNWLKTDRR